MTKPANKLVTIALDKSYSILPSSLDTVEAVKAYISHLKEIANCALVVLRFFAYGVVLSTSCSEGRERDSKYIGAKV